jgi:hypothetical protein
MANKFLDWVDRVGLPVSGLIAVWGAIFIAALLVVRLFFKF